jgi:hypothetical protein
MKDEAKKGKAGSNLGVLAERTATAELHDSASNKMRKAASAVGNEELKQRIEAGKAGRDELLQFLVGRLKTIRSVQEKELALASVDRMPDWAKMVGDKQKGVGKPEPTRWKEVARAYEEAAHQLCRGALGRGRQLVERAIQVEKDTIGELTKLVELTDDMKPEAPARMQGGGTDDACPATNVPQEIKQLVADIENVTQIAKDPPQKRRIRDPWWTLEEEEEEEEADA